MYLTLLQQNRPFHKWKERSKIGIYLGRSPQHPQNVARVLSLETGLVSPQFHVTFNSTFETVRQHPQPLESKWQIRFVTQRENRLATITQVRSKPKSKPLSQEKKRKRAELYNTSNAHQVTQPRISSLREPAERDQQNGATPIP
jgi:tRNA/tmRNA/rRNA uracil-C5-methylase (TrmA/RlmC/RlmD family)